MFAILFLGLLVVQKQHIYLDQKKTTENNVWYAHFFIS